MFSKTFIALLKEAQFTKEMLGSGATQIRAANYAAKGIYFQAFTSLSTGIERIGKLCLIIDYFLDHNGTFPNLNYMKNNIGHNIELIYKKSQETIVKHHIKMNFLKDLNTPVHQSMLRILSEFAKGDRYSNINLIVGIKQSNDPLTAWFTKVESVLFKTRVSEKRKQKIAINAKLNGSMLTPHTIVRHSSESGSEISEVEEASYRTGMQKAVAPLRQLYVLQIIRYWSEMLSSLQHIAMQRSSHDFPDFSEIFAPFNNYDSYIKRRKTWDTV